MNGLLDTHSFLWWVLEDPRLSNVAHQFIANPENKVFVSVASAWEITIKAGIGKLQITGTPEMFIEKHIASNGFQVLPIELKHAVHTFQLPFHHRDPFDRILIAQSRIEQMPLLTADSLITQYTVNTLW